MQNPIFTIEPVLLILMNKPLGSHSAIRTFPLAVESTGSSVKSLSVLRRFLLGVTVGVIFSLETLELCLKVKGSIHST